MLQQALDRGHIVKALVRSPEKVTLQHDNLQVIYHKYTSHIISLCLLVYFMVLHNQISMSNDHEPSFDELTLSYRW